MHMQEFVIKNELLVRVAPTDVVYTSGDKEIINQLELWIHNPSYSTKKVFYNSIGLSHQDQLPNLEEHLVGLTMIGIFFPYGQMMGDLTSVETAERIKIEGDSNEHTWYCVHDYTSTYGHVWKIFPEEDVELLPGESLKFIISNIVVDSKPGLTSMYIKEKGNSNMEIVQIYKKPGPTIKMFTNGMIYGQGYQLATIEWKVENASYCMLTPGDTVRYAPNGNVNLYGPDKKCDITYTLQAFVDNLDTPLVTQERQIHWEKVVSPAPEILSGRASAGYNTHTDWRLHIVDNQNLPRTYRLPVVFSKPFIRAYPQVIATIDGIDVDKNRNLRVNVNVENVTSKGFDLVFLTWWDTILYEVKVSWIAFA